MRQQGFESEGKEGFHVFVDPVKTVIKFQCCTVLNYTLIVLKLI